MSRDRNGYGNGSSGGLNGRQDGRYRLAQQIADALNPDKAGKAPSPVKTLKDMTPEEIAALEKSLGAKVRR
jgi:hypothetical protein